MFTSDLLPTNFRFWVNAECVWQCIKIRSKTRQRIGLCYRSLQCIEKGVVFNDSNYAL